MESGAKTTKLSAEQKEEFIKYLSKYANALFKSAKMVPSIDDSGYNYTEDMWDEMVRKLNEMGPPKTSHQWKKCKCDVATGVRRKIVLLQSYRKKYPNELIDSRRIPTEAEKQLYDILTKKMYFAKKKITFTIPDTRSSLYIDEQDEASMENDEIEMDTTANNNGQLDEENYNDGSYDDKNFIIRIKRDNKFQNNFHQKNTMAGRQKRKFLKYLIKYARILCTMKLPCEHPDYDSDKAFEMNKRRERIWKKVVADLNKLGNPKTPFQWSKCKLDMIRNLRRRHLRQSRNSQSRFNTLLPDEMKLFKILNDDLKYYQNRYRRYESYAEIDEILSNDEESETSEINQVEETIENNSNSHENENNNNNSNENSFGECSNYAFENFVSCYEAESKPTRGQIIIKDVSEKPSHVEKGKTKINIKREALESIAKQKIILEDLKELKKNLQNKTSSCESCSENNKKILDIQQKSYDIQVSILEEQKRNNILQNKNLEIQLKILAELKNKF